MSFFLVHLVTFSNRYLDLAFFWIGLHPVTTNFLAASLNLDNKDIYPGFSLTAKKFFLKLHVVKNEKIARNHPRLRINATGLIYPPPDLCPKVSMMSYVQTTTLYSSQAGVYMYVPGGSPV